MSDWRTTGVILCGGRGRRMGTARKPLLTDVRGQALVDYLIRRLRPQVERLMISANDNVNEYRHRHVPVIRDRTCGVGPLAGIHAAASEASTPWLVVCPGDAPSIPPDFVATLQHNLRGADAAYVHDGFRDHYLHLIVRTSVAIGLWEWTQAGGCRVSDWLASIPAHAVTVSTNHGDFSNINTRREYADWQEHTEAEACESSHSRR